MTAPDASRGVVLVDGRAVHYRRAGRGPVVVALHGSPESGKALAPLMAALADRFTVIAPDTPGNGDSDPLEHAQPEAADYGRALLAFLDALGLGRVALYGFHTGAGTAMEAALAAPDRVTALVLDGYAIWTDDERGVFLDGRYLLPFEPSWDGAHLAHLWARVEEQSVFFPYFDARDAARIPMDVPSLDQLQRRALDWLKSGDGYRKPYAAAFRRRGAEALRTVSVPTLLGACPPDPLTDHLDRATDRAAAVTLERWSDRASSLDRIGAFLTDHPGDAAPRGSVHSFSGGLHYRRGGGPGGGRPLLLLHDAGGSSRLFAPALPVIAERRDVIALDLPGHGLSDEVAAPADWAGAVRDWMQAVGLMDAAVAGFHFGGRIAAALAADDQRRPAAAGLIGAPIFTAQDAADRLAHYASDLTPSWEGAHLLRAWRMLRRQALFDPWYAATREAMTGQVGPLDVNTLHRRFVDLVRAGDAARAAYADQHQSDLGALVRRAGGVTVFRVRWDPLSAPHRIAMLGENVAVNEIALADAPAQWGEALAGWAL